jgi:hypothetical protein
MRTAQREGAKGPLEDTSGSDARSDLTLTQSGRVAKRVVDVKV